MNENSEKKVLVTGASGGIGRAIALAAAQAGYEIVACPFSLYHRKLLFRLECLGMSIKFFFEH